MENTEAPAAKRLKTKIDDEVSIRAILSNEYNEDISFIKVHCCQVEKKQELQMVIQQLSQKLPHFRHLKRVNGRHVLICPSADINDTLKQHLERHSFSEHVVKVLCKNVKIIEVPANMAKLRVQYNEMIKYWPCKFHPDIYFESLLNGKNFNLNQRIFHKRMAQLLQALARDLCAENPVGICVDPRYSSIVAIASSNGNSYKHCVMLLIDFVARSQQGGTQQVQQSFTKDLQSECLITMQGIPQIYHDYIQNNELFKDLQFGAECKPSQIHSVFRDCPMDNLKKYGPYLCTGYDVYLLREPCLMCSMALVHSRAKRIFVLEASDNGALFSRFKLHAVKELNHHYEVFQLKTNTKNT